MTFQSHPNQPVSLTDEILRLVSDYSNAMTDVFTARLTDREKIAERTLDWTRADAALRARLSAIESELNDLRKNQRPTHTADGRRIIGWCPWVDGFAQTPGHDQPSGLPCSSPVELGDEEGG